MWLWVLILLGLLYIAIKYIPRLGGKEREFRVTIIGSGFGGLCAAIKLKEAGYQNVTIIEKNDDVGGTWLENTYPGCGCDVMSYMYGYSFYIKPDWTRFWAKQPEILNYIREVAKKFKIYDIVKFGTKVEKAEFISSENLWNIHLVDVKTGNTSVIQSNIVVSAVGQLNVPKIPNYDGLKDFKGVYFHSARWNHEVDLNNKTVAIIGTGATSVQVVPEVCKVAKQIYLVQRSPSYIFPKGDAQVPKWVHALFKYVPFTARIYRCYLYFLCELNFLSLLKETRAAKYTREMCLNKIKTDIKNEGLAKLLTPTFDVGCKRILISDDWFPSIQRSNLTLVEGSFLGTTSTSIMVSNQNGKQDIPVDVIVFCNGFETTNFLSSLELTVLEEDPVSRTSTIRSLTKQWENYPEAYLGMTVENFPNLFVLYGPNTNLGHHSIVFMHECQCDYLVSLLDWVDDHRYKKFKIKKEEVRKYGEFVQTRMKALSFSSECDSWYRKKDSTHISNNSPFCTMEYWYRTRTLNPAHYDFS